MNHTVTDTSLRQQIDDLANQLCRTVDGDFNFHITTKSHDPLFQKLRMLVNATLDSAREGIESVKQEKERLETQRRLIAERDQAQALAQAKSDFLANMSHEIRTPMHGVLAMCELLFETPLTAEQKKLLNTQFVSAKALLHILNDILDISKLEAKQVQVEHIPFDLTDVLESVGDLMVVQATQKGIRFETHMHCTHKHWLGDAQRLRQILINLLGNAVKFTDTGLVSLTVEHSTAASPVGGQPQDWLTFKVSDTGIGINPQSLTQLFQKFNQIDPSTTRKFGGTGLGLAITKELVQLMGGQIDVRSQPGQGSTFTVSLPMDPAAAPQQSNAPTNLDTVSAPTHIQHIHVLLAEDNEINQLTVQGMLAPHVATLHIVNNGQSALEAVQAQAFDLVLMDVQMPVLSGVDATRAIRKLGGPLAQVPIVALTANALVSDRERFLQSGFTDYLSKPFRRSQLLSLVQRLTQGLTQPSSATGLLSAPSHPIKWFNAALFNDNFSVFDRSEQIKLLHTAAEQIKEAVVQLQTAKAAQSLQDIEQICHRLAGAMGAVALEQLSHLARSAMEQTQHTRHHNNTAIQALEAPLQALEQHAQEVLSKLKQPEGLLALNARQPH